MTPRELEKYPLIFDRVAEIIGAAFRFYDNGNDIETFREDIIHELTFYSLECEMDSAVRAERDALHKEINKSV